MTPSGTGQFEGARRGSRLLVWAVLALAVSSVTCARIPAHEEAAPPAKSPLLAIAESKADEYWTAHLSKCGETYAAESTLMGDLKVVWEVAGVRFSVTEKKLNEADRLNGISWLGDGFVSGTASRTDFHTTWTPFENPERGLVNMWWLTLGVVKGSWVVKPVNGVFEKFPCDKLQK